MELTEDRPDPAVSAAMARQLLLNRRNAINRLQTQLENPVLRGRARRKVSRQKIRLIRAVMATANEPKPSTARAANAAKRKARDARIRARREKRAAELEKSAAFKRGEFKPTFE